MPMKNAIFRVFIVVNNTWYYSGIDYIVYIRGEPSVEVLVFSDSFYGGSLGEYEASARTADSERETG